MYKSGLVPRWMPWLGLIGGPLLLIGSIGMLFDWWDQADGASPLVIPEFLWELFLGIYAAVWGFRKDAPILSPRPGRWLHRPKPRRRTVLLVDADIFRPVSRHSPHVLAAAAGPVWRRVRGALRVAWFLSGGNTPDYTAADQDWTTWADDNQWKSRIGGFLILLAGFVFLHFAATIRSVLGSAEATVGGSVQLARVAFAGALTGITGITMAIVMIAAAATEGADADPVVSRAVTTAAAGPYFVAAMGFAVMLAAAGLLTLRTRVFARWIGIVALVGAISFLITFLALIQGTSEDSVFGYGFLPGILALTIWSIATSLAAYRAVATDAR